LSFKKEASSFTKTRFLDEKNDFLKLGAGGKFLKSRALLPQ
jgi:hypothetical protein